MLKHTWWTIKCLFGFGSVKDGSVCWYSKIFYDIHDYHKHKGGDGVPCHFYTYHCSECDETFTI